MQFAAYGQFVLVTVWISKLRNKCEHVNSCKVANMFYFTAKLRIKYKSVYFAMYKGSALPLRVSAKITLFEILAEVIVCIPFYCMIFQTLTLMVLEGGGQDRQCDARFTEKGPCSHNNNTAIINQRSILPRYYWG